MPPEASVVRTSIVGCARCHGDGHLDLEFRPLTHPVDLSGWSRMFTHWAPCPANGEPILVRFARRDEEDDA